MEGEEERRRGRVAGGGREGWEGGEEGLFDSLAAEVGGGEVPGAAGVLQSGSVLGGLEQRIRPA